MKKPVIPMEWRAFGFGDGTPAFYRHARRWDYRQFAGATIK
jgi:hypothetical protein